MHQIRQRTQTNTRPCFTCGGLSSEEMILTLLTEKQFISLPQSEKQFYKKLIQYSNNNFPNQWTTLDEHTGEGFKEMFPNQIYRNMYVLKDLN